MTTIFLIRHAESIANANHQLAGRMDYALTEQGKQDASILAAELTSQQPIDRIWCSPLLRAQQTAAPFMLAANAPMRIDDRLLEQHMGRFSGLSYTEVENDSGYCANRAARWDWVPEGGGESYRMIAVRVQSFFSDLRNDCRQDGLRSVLLVTHAVTLRLFRACIEGTLPTYPETIAANGEVWRVNLNPEGVPAGIETLMLAHGSRMHKA